MWLIDKPETTYARNRGARAKVDVFYGVVTWLQQGKRDHLDGRGSFLVVIILWCLFGLAS